MIIFQKLESLAILIGSLYWYHLLGFSWVMFAALILAPDISMLGYLINNKIGAVTYNTVHNYLTVVAIILVGLYLQANFFVAIGVILATHIGADRALGIGLKLPTGFKDTHLGKMR